MYYYISGDLVKTDVNTAVVDNHGIAYILNVSLNTLQHLSGADTVKLYTYYSVREDAQELFGFYDEEELSAFKLLITVSGVGPKAALAILSTLSPEKLAAAVSCSDVKAITAAQGVGKKIAERVVLELKDKFTAPAAGGEAIGEDNLLPATDNLSEAINALVVLGYSRSEAARAMDGIDTANMAIDDMIRAALRRMM